MKKIAAVIFAVALAVVLFQTVVVADTHAAPPADGPTWHNGYDRAYPPNWGYPARAYPPNWGNYRPYYGDGYYYHNHANYYQYYRYPYYSRPNCVNYRYCCSGYTYNYYYW